jgi:hypothetical protein
MGQHRLLLGVLRQVGIAGLAALALGGCAPRQNIPPVPERVPDSADSADVALARKLAPVLYAQRDEPFPLIRVVAVLHPVRPIIAYHLLWRHDVNGQWVPWAKPSDEEEVWVGYDPQTHTSTDLWTYWHGSILHAQTHGMPAAISVQWGKHGSLPRGIAEGDLPRTKTLNVFYALEVLLLPDMLLGRIAHGGPLGFNHSYRRYRDFSTVLPLANRLDAVVRAEDARPALRTVFGSIYAHKRPWPDNAQTQPASNARDPHEVQPERPTVATHAGTVSPGWLELETGGEWDRYTDGGRVLSFPTTLKIGVAPGVQANISAAGFRGTQSDAEARGIGDVTFGLKYRLLDDAPVLGDFAILPSVKFPTASSARGLGTGTTDISLLLISSRTVGSADVDINLGATRRSGNGFTAPKVATLWTVSVGMPIVGQLGWDAEIFGLPGTSGPAGSKGIVALLTGPSFQPVKWLALDAGVIAPLTGPQPKAVYGGLVWNIGKLF